MRAVGRIAVLVGWLLGVTLGQAWAAGSKPRWPPEKEEAVGQRACGEMEKQIPVWHDAEAQGRLERILAELAQHVQPAGVPYALPPVDHPPINWKVKLLATDEVNAVSLPGGFVYVTRGLYRAAESDDELAAAMSHEMAHTLLYHALAQEGKSTEVLIGSLAAAALAIVLGRGNTDATSAVMAAGTSLGQGVLSQYSIKDEQEADNLGLAILRGSHYNAVAMLTVLEGLGRGKQLLPRPLVDIYQTHPYPEDRVRNVRAKLDQLGVPIDRLAVTRWDEAEAVDCFDEGRVRPQLCPWGEVVFTGVASSEKGETPVARLTAAARALTEALGHDLREYEVQPGMANGRPTVMVRGAPILTVYEEDAAVAGQTPRQAAEEAAKAVRRAIARKTLEAIY